MRAVWIGKCPRCGWGVVWRWRKHPMHCQRCPQVELEWKRQQWA